MVAPEPHEIEVTSDLVEAIVRKSVSSPDEAPETTGQGGTTGQAGTDLACSDEISRENVVEDGAAVEMEEEEEDEVEDDLDSEVFPDVDSDAVPTEDLVGRRISQVLNSHSEVSTTHA